MNKKILLLILVIVLAVSGYFLLGGNKSGNKGDNKSDISDNNIVISMTEDGFFPSTINIKQGETVVFKNDGAQDHWPASAIHPTHLVYPEFDSKKSVASGDSWSFAFTKKGSWRYHDHLNPTFTGTINVE